jgi:outer membrane protein assembly factor BamB
MAAIAIVLLTVSAFALMANLPVNAQVVEHGGGGAPLCAGETPDVTYESIAYLSYRPDPVGVGQSLLVNVWLQPPIHVARFFEDAFLVTLTKPDGTEIKIGPFSSYYGDSTGWVEYTPNEVGTWQIKLDFLGAYFPPGIYTSEAAYTYGQELVAELGIYYEPDSDGPYTFEVQEDLVFSWPPADLPTDYWTRPASIENREWWPILGNFPPDGTVGGGPNWPAETNRYMSNYDFIPYVQAPNTAHIAWKEQRSISGLVGGNLGQLATTGAGNGFNIIYAGRAYGTVSKPGSGIDAVTYWQCYDLRTGELIWERPLSEGEQAPNLLSYITRTISAVPGDVASSRGRGVHLMRVGGGRLKTWDPWTGELDWDISIAPLSSGTFYANGVDAPIFLSVQNLGGGNYRLINWTIIGDIGYPDLRNRRLGVLSNVSFPFSSWNSVDFESMIAVRRERYNPPSTGVGYYLHIKAASLITGELLWNITTPNPKSGLEGYFSGSANIADHGKFAMRLNDGHWHCWDLRTGQYLWKGELSSWPWGIWGAYGSTSYGGMILANQYDGCVALDWDTGKIVWHYKDPAPYEFEVAYYDEDHQSVNPFFTGTIRIADGKIYTYNTEHTVTLPYPRGWKLHCIDATTGEGIWNITGSMNPRSIADGYLTATNSYDGHVYVFGKGKSETTVTAPDVAVPKGTAITIKGTVLDLSPAQPGTPCVSKDSMTTQMQYLHMQHPIGGLGGDAIITGVPVSLSAVDESGNHVDIGTTTTNGYFGTFGFEWTPPDEGKYEIIASFLGDHSYGSSGASTYVTVGAAPEEVDLSPVENSVSDVKDSVSSLTTYIIVILVVAIIGLVIALYLALKPRK